MATLREKTAYHYGEKPKLPFLIFITLVFAYHIKFFVLNFKRMLVADAEYRCRYKIHLATGKPLAQFKRVSGLAVMPMAFGLIPPKWGNAFNLKIEYTSERFDNVD